MKSPFPGMDPYVERHWRDVHASLIIYARDQLQPQLPGKLFARVEERLVVEPEEGDERSIYPDVRVVEQTVEKEGASSVALDVAAEPVVVTYEAEPATETFVNIYEPGTPNRLITVIEVLSLSNKLTGESQNQYRQKQRELRTGKVSLVEIDLLRSGKRVLSLPNARIPRRARTIYQVCVRRGWQPSTFEVYPVPLQQPLPTIKIPLRKRDDDVRLNLQVLFEQAYVNGAYRATVDYREPPDPPLRGPDAEWARALLQANNR